MADSTSTERSPDDLTVSSSTLEDKDVSIFFHPGVRDKALEAERFLAADDITCCLIERDGPAGRFKIENIRSAAKHTRARVIILTKKFVEEDLNYHTNILLDPKVCTTKNTLILAPGKQLRSLPLTMKHFESQNFQKDVTGRLIARFVNKFLQKHPLRSPIYSIAEDDTEPEGISSSQKPAQEHYLEMGIDSEYETKFKRFEKIFGKPDKKRAYMLITSPIREVLPGLENIAQIPWVRVFDFDPKSRVSGLLSVTEQPLRRARHHTKTDRLDDIEVPEDNTTNWVFINGYTDGEESLHPTSSKGLNRQAIYKHAQILSEYCAGKKVHTFLVMWYAATDSMDSSLDRLLTGIEVVFNGVVSSFNCVICIEKMPERGTQLYSTLDRLELREQTVVVPLNVLCKWLATSFHTNGTKVKYTLPKFSDEDEDLTTVEIAKEDVNWINVHFNLLTTPNSRSKDSDPINDGHTFLKGREVTWNIVGKEEFVVERSLLTNVKTYLEEKHTSIGLTGMITVFHFPGGGGSTFSRRLLWEFREKNPCVELSSIQVNIGELYSRLKYLRRLTALPLVLLADGKSDHDINKILKIGRELPITVIQVKRYYSMIKKPMRFQAGNCYLTDKVTKKESDDLCRVYGKIVPRKLNNLQSLWPKNKKRVPALFEYGLTAFQSEFHGVRRYVHGFLRITSDDDTKPWHVVLAFLSLANYYGHKEMPSYLFGKILGIKSNDVVDLEDLPHAARQFLTEDRYGYWKITHYIVSKEILEQLLVKRSSMEYDNQANQLSKSAREKLCQWALTFIENVKAHVEGCQVLPGHVSDLLTSIFIKRYYRDPAENEIDSKSLFSRLVLETESKKDQRAIFEKLVECFPTNPEFHAHLGRFHYKQSQFQEAEKHLHRAIETKRKTASRSEVLPGDDVMHRIYNMFGYCCNAQVVHAIGASLGRIEWRTIANKSLPTLIRLCLEKARKAINVFESGRKWYQGGSDPAFGYMGEIKVRLHLTELALVISDRDVQRLEKDRKPYSDLYQFVMESFHECDHLLAQCIYYSSETKLPEDEINFCINKFQTYFKSSETALKHWAGKDTSVMSKRCHISVLKMNLKRSSKDHRFRIYDDVRTRPDIMQLVSLLEGVLDGVFSQQNLRVRVSNYMMEWLQAIRHPMIARDYSQSDVLSRVKKWEERNETGSLATFYRYVITTSLSISSPRGEVAYAYRLDASKTLDKMENHAIPLHYLNRSLEWISVCDRPDHINSLMHISKLGERNGKFWSDKRKLSKLRVCTGVIVQCKVYRGNIILDGGNTNVFFVPQNFEIGASHSKQMTRVEFYLGFNPRHKAEAFEVTLLQKYQCPECNMPTEIPTLGREKAESKASCNKCEAMVYKL